jgi:hypothetical protein
MKIMTLVRAVAVVAALSLEAPAATLFADSFSLPNGLITNDYATYHASDPAAKASPSWIANSGSLFARNGSGWTGVPDTIVSNAGSTNGTGSAIFRLYTKRADFGDVSLRLRLFVEGLTSTTQTPAHTYDGVHLWLRYLDETRLYAVTIGRRDGIAVIKKKIPGGISNGGTYYNVSSEARVPIPFGTWRTVEASAQNNADGSVTLKLLVNGTLVAQGVDRNVGGAAPWRAAGRVGVRGDNCQFLFDDLTVSSLGTTAVPSPIAATNVAAKNVTASGAQISWQTAVVTHSQVEYGATAAYGQMSPRSTATGLWHGVTLSGLKAGTLYHYRVRSYADDGREGVSGDYTFTTPGAPVATNVAATEITSSGARLVWQTNVVTHSQADFGLTSSYGTTTGRSSATGLWHGVLLSGLKPGTLYHYRVRSYAPGGSEGVSGDYTFTTAGAPAPAQIAATNVAALNVTATGAHISWKTSVVTHSQVDYGATSSYGKTTARSAASGLWHGVTLSGLAPNTVYHYRVRSYADDGREGVSGDFVFRTAASATTAAR